MIPDDAIDDVVDSALMKHVVFVNCHFLLTLTFSFFAFYCSNLKLILQIC